MQMHKNGRLGEGIAWRAPARRQPRQVGPPCYRFPAAGLTVFPFLVNSLHLSRGEEPGRTAATLKTLVPREQVEVRRRRTTGRVLFAASESGPHRTQGEQDVAVQLQFSQSVGRLHKPQAGDPDAAPRGWHGDLWKREGASQGDGHTQVRPGSLPGQLAGQRGRPVWLPGPARALRLTGLPPANQGQCGLDGASPCLVTVCARKIARRNRRVMQSFRGRFLKMRMMKVPKPFLGWLVWIYKKSTRNTSQRG